MGRKLIPPSAGANDPSSSVRGGGRRLGQSEGNVGTLPIMRIFAARMIIAAGVWSPWQAG